MASLSTTSIMMVPTTDSSEVSRTSSSILRMCSHVTAGWEVSRRAQRGLSDAGHLCRYQEQDCSRGCGRHRHRRAKTQWAKSAVNAVLAANTARMEHGLGRGCAKSLVETRVRRVSQKCFDTVGRTRSRSKTCGASGSRRSRRFHMGH